jgi:diacylglycerol O-acyltransferase
VRVPLGGAPAERLAQVAASTRARKARSRGSSLALLAPAFRLLATLGLFRWFVERQRLVNTFLTNLRGPQDLALAGHRVRRIAPIGVIAGNVAVAFAALSYAGRLTVTVVTDPQVAPEGAAIAAALDATLAELAALA